MHTCRHHVPATVALNGFTDHKVVLISVMFRLSVNMTVISIKAKARHIANIAKTKDKLTAQLSHSIMTSVSGYSDEV